MQGRYVEISSASTGSVEKVNRLDMPHSECLNFADPWRIFPLSSLRDLQFSW
jgi:hypothetical protein